MICTIILSCGKLVYKVLSQTHRWKRNTVDGFYLVVLKVCGYRTPIPVDLFSRISIFRHMFLDYKA